jgi:hypothetical protein
VVRAGTDRFGALDRPTNDRAYEIRVDREDDEPLFVLPIKQITVIDPSVPLYRTDL